MTNLGNAAGGRGTAVRFRFGMPRRVDDAVAYTWEHSEPMVRYGNPKRWREYVGWAGE